MPPKQSAVWTWWNKNNAGNAECIFCGHEVANNATRLAKHTLVCKELIKKNPEVKAQVMELGFDGLLSKVTPGEAGAHKRQSALETVSLDAKRQRQANSELCKAFITGATPFSFVMNQHFINFCHMLNPAYKPPHRTTVGDGCRSVGKDLRTTVMEAAQKWEGITVVYDFWKDKKEEHHKDMLVVGVRSLTEPRSTFLKFHHPPPGNKTAEDKTCVNKTV